MNPKIRASVIFRENLELASINQTQFRRKVMDTLIAEFSTPEKAMSVAAAATYYNTAKKQAEQDGLVKGLGRNHSEEQTPPNQETTCHAATPITSTVYSNKTHGDSHSGDDEPCFTVLEVINGFVERTMSFGLQGDASEHIDERRLNSPSNWKLISGIGPNSGERYSLRQGEKELQTL